MKYKLLAAWSNTDSNEFVVKGATRRVSYGISTSESAGELDLLCNESDTRVTRRLDDFRSFRLEI